MVPKLVVSNVIGRWRPWWPQLDSPMSQMERNDEISQASSQVLVCISRTFCGRCIASYGCCRNLTFGLWKEPGECPSRKLMYVEQRVFGRRGVPTARLLRLGGSEHRWRGGPDGCHRVFC